jgi:DNA-directed RNA polymerase subunit M/transcription elongation factor TFIIS/uncharacterized membrane protein
MATSIVISCPECGKQIKVAEEVIGKKIRCKECQAVFPVKAPKASPSAKAAPPKKKADDDLPIPLAAADDDDDELSTTPGNPYTLMQEEVSIPRCPQCAKEMESLEAVICVHCGYNMVTRRKAETRAIYETTGSDIFLWLLPGLVAVLVILVMIGVDVLCWMKMKSWAAGSWMEGEEPGTWNLRPNAFNLYITLALTFVGLILGKFAYKRLFVNNRPAEREIEKRYSED